MFIDLIYLDTTFQYVTYHLFFVLNDLPLNNMTYPSGYSKCYLYHTLNIILVMYKTYMCPPKLTIKIVEQIICMDLYVNFQNLHEFYTRVMMKIWGRAGNAYNFILMRFEDTYNLLL